MLRTTLRIAVVVFMLLPVRAGFAQEATTKMTAPAAAPLITGVASAERLRFTAPNTVVQMQLQIYSDDGRVLFDATSKGNVLDWTLQDGSGERLLPGSYLCVVTVKGLSGRLSQRVGSAVVREKQVELQRVEPTKFTTAQQQAVGPIEENGALTILNADEAPATTVLANNGTEGQMIRSRGALTFRIGNFFTGEDREQMRLTEDGKLGIGTDKPESKLDVSGDIRTTGTLRAQRIEFPNGTIQTSGQSGKVDDQGNVTPSATGTGTQNQLSKWTDNSGTLGDSGLTEIGGRIGVGTTNPQFKLDLVDDNSGAGGFQLANPANGTLAQLQNRLVNNNGAFAYYGITSSAYTGAPILSNRAFFGSYQIDTVIWTQTANDILFATNGLNANTERMRIKANGNIGIGTNNPQSLLDVAGNINTSTQYNIGGNGVLSVTGGISGFRNSNTFAGVDAGAATSPFLTDDGGNFNSFFGSQAGVTNTVGYKNAFFGFNAGQANTFGDSNSFFGSTAGYSNTGGFLNTFVGSGSGLKNQTGKENSFFGYAAGQNSKGDSNTFIGFRTGSQLNSGSNNTLLGTAADVGADNLNNATALGSGAIVSQSNSLVLGNGANVGIGTTAPVNVLHLNGNHNDFALTFTNQSNTVGRRGYRIAFDSDRLTFQSANDSGAFAANQMTIDPSTGNVGIGTTAPSFKLHINDPSNTGLRVQNNTSGGTVAGFGGFGDFQIDTITTTGGRFTVKENGNTGIGTNNPNAKLQVAGGNIYVTNPNGVIISSPNGTCWQIGVSNAGALTTIATPCP